ncbi:MAG: SDR family NAD(P)-dependent oxidoreductase [Promethearchaeota archaeon]|jgi:NAD(P)-dependent dehydrogenase (short-subunit alcohol dehydrogenase family)
MMKDNFLEGKVALVTGAGSGFGREMAVAFASKGGNLVLNDINLSAIRETKEIISKLYDVDILLVEADISSEEQVNKMSKEVFQKFNNVYLLINNAGIRGGSSSLKTKTADYDRVMDVNVKGAWNVTRAFYKKMRKQKFDPIAGKIINITSCAGTECGLNPLIGMYSVSKAALIAFTKLWALELGPYNMTVNAICPGIFLTPIYNNDLLFIREWIKLRNIKIPLDTIGEAKQVADVALFLASPASDYITGQNIVVDGGMTVSINKI